MRSALHTPRTRIKRHLALAAVATLLATGPRAGTAETPTPIKAVGVENEYADVIGQVGGRYVTVSAIETDPNTDPHSFEVSPSVAARIAAAELIVKNGLGYDAWVDKIIAAAPNAGRKVIDVQHLLGLPDSTSNPHVWYDPATMPAVAKAVAADLATMQPTHAAYFEARLATFDASLAPWRAAIASFRQRYPNTPVAVTEPVVDDMLNAAGCDIQSPTTLQAAIMNGTDPSPQDVSIQRGLFIGRKVRVFLYNRQVTDTLTQTFLALARKNRIPVVGVYETMPTPGYTYQSWMIAEVTALQAAVAARRSTETLQAR